MSDTTFNFAYPIKHGDTFLTELDCEYVSQGSQDQPYFKVFSAWRYETVLNKKRFIPAVAEINEGPWHDKLCAWVDVEHGKEAADADRAWEASANIQARRDAVELRAAE